MGFYNIRRFKKAATRTDRGASIVEYSLLVMFLAIGSIMAFGAVGQAANGSFEQVAESFDTPIIEDVENSDDDAENSDEEAENSDDDGQNSDDDGQNGDDNAQNGDGGESGQSGDGDGDNGDNNDGNNNDGNN